MIKTYKLACSGNCGKTISVRKERIKEDGNYCRSCATVKANKERRIIHCRSCGIELTKENRPQYGKKKKSVAFCISCLKEKEHKKRLEIKKLVMNYYGGECSCCGENRIEFLTLDHINNDGAEHRRNHKNSFGDKLYSYLLKNDFYCEYELQILCWNCNLAKQNYGICPHRHT